MVKAMRRNRRGSAHIAWRRCIALRRVILNRRRSLGRTITVLLMR